jgi:NAD-dependent dihydropyrimidine dehydrogenase PreA subunit
MSTITIDAELCNGCGLCLDSCPVDVFRIDETTRKAVAVYARDCQICFLCEDDCPQKAISIDFAMQNPRRRSIYDQLNIETDV